MVSSRILVGAAILVFALGLLAAGYDVYNKTRESPPIFQKMDGLSLCSTRSLKPNYYSLLILSINPMNKSVLANFYLNFSTESPSFSIFGQSPCDLASLRLTSEMSSSEPNIININDRTYFYQEFFNVEPGEHTISYTFYWENYLSKVSYSKFRLIVPFNIGYPQDIGETGINVGSNYQITPGKADEARLSIRLPTESTNIYTMPTPDNISYYPENIWYIWDLKARSDPLEGVSTAFWMDFESITLIGQKENNIFLSGVLIAAGFGGTFSGIIFILDNLLKRPAKNSDKTRRSIGRSRKTSEA